MDLHGSILFHMFAHPPTLSSLHFPAMRPLNAKQRRKQFLLFLLLFIVAIIPVVLLVYGDGRADATYIEALNKRSAQKEVADRDAEASKRKVNEMYEYVLGLKKSVVDKSGDVERLNKDHSTSFGENIESVSKLTVDLYDHADSMLFKMVQDLTSTTRILNAAYKQGCIKKEEYDKLDKSHGQGKCNPVWSN